MCAYLIEVVDASFASVVIFDYDGLPLFFVTDVWMVVFRAQEQHILSPSLDVRDQCVGLCESKSGGEDRSLSCLEQMAGKLRIAFTNRTNQGQIPPEQLVCQREGGEIFVTGNDMPLELLCHVQDQTHPLVDFSTIASFFSRVRLQFPDV